MGKEGARGSKPVIRLAGKLEFKFRPNMSADNRVRLPDSAVVKAEGSVPEPSALTLFGISTFGA